MSSLLKRNYRLLNLVMLTAILSACGAGKLETSSGGTSSALGTNTNLSSSSKAGSSIEATIDPKLTSGLTHYQTLCMSCHDNAAMAGADGQGIIKIDPKNFISEAVLAKYITEEMPSGNIGACAGECATSIATFILNNFSTNPNGSGSNTSASSASSTTNNINIAPVPTGLRKISPVTIHRLNRSEYNNTIRDLFNTTLKPADAFPEDDFGYGFNNIADVLSISLAHVEQYEKAADVLITEALGSSAVSNSQEFNAENYGSTNGNASNGYWIQYAAGAVIIPVTVKSAGRYSINIVAGQMPGGPQNVNMQLSLNGVKLKDFDVAAPLSKMSTYSINATFLAGLNSVTMTFTNDYYVKDVADSNLAIDTLEVQGPLDVVSASTIEGLTCGTFAEGIECARNIAENFGLRAWRRPLSTLEKNELVALYEMATQKGAAHKESLKQMLKALLLSSHFMYRPELDADLKSTTPHALNQYELASRLSYFLWSSMPDTKLLNLAATNKLSDSLVLRSEVQRMLDDAKSSMLIENFAVQWLKFDKVLEANPDLKKFPSFNAALVQAMRQETRLFMKDMIKNNEPIANIFTANYTYLNQTLAEHYGISGISGANFQRFTWSNADARRGILGQASVLTATSHPTNTSPVLRGKWVLESLLCDEPPPPPPGIENITNAADLVNLPTRQRFEAHSKSGSSCFGCHQTMDPIGFGLENFNAIGQWRTVDGNVAVDASGKLPSGESFNGSLALGNILAASYKLPMCTTEHLLTFALGHGFEALGYGNEKPDYPLVYDIYQKTSAKGYKIRDIIEEIVVSDAFRMRTGADSQAGISQ